MKTIYVSIDRRMDKGHVEYIYITYNMEKIKCEAAIKNKSCICDNINALWGLYAQLNKSDWERQILCEITNKQNLKKNNLMKTKSRLVIARD